MKKPNCGRDDCINLQDQNWKHNDWCQNCRYYTPEPLPEGAMKLPTWDELEIKMREFETVKSMKVHNTDVDTKRRYWPVFEKMLRNQFMHGGDKYSLTEDKEITDWVCELSPGKTGCDWVLQTMAKYIGRFLNFGREKDLLKIATYCFIAWLKCGFHLQEQHDEDVKK